MSHILRVSVTDTELQLHRCDQALLVLQQVLTDATREIAKLGDTSGDSSDSEDSWNSDDEVEESAPGPRELVPGTTSHPDKNPGPSYRANGTVETPSTSTQLSSWFSAFFQSEKGEAPSWLLYLRELAGPSDGSSLGENDDLWALGALARIWRSTEWLECFVLPALEYREKQQQTHLGHTEKQTAAGAGRDALQLQTAAGHICVLLESIARRPRTMSMHQMFSGVVAADFLVLSVGPMLEPESVSEARKVFRDIHSESDTEIVNPSQIQRLLLQTALAEMAGVLLPCVEKELEENRLVQPKRLNTPYPNDLPSLIAYLRQVTLQKWPMEGNREPGPYLSRLREAIQGSWVRRCPLEACEEASGVFRYVGSQQEARQKMPSPALVHGALEGAAQILRAFKGDGNCLASSNRLTILCRSTDGNCSSGIAEITVKSDACSHPGSASISRYSSCNSSKFANAMSGALQSPGIAPPQTPPPQTQPPYQDLRRELSGLRSAVFAEPVAAEPTLAEPYEGTGTVPSIEGNEIDQRLLEALLESANHELVIMWEQRRDLESQNCRLKMDLDMLAEEAALAESTVYELRTQVDLAEEKSLGDVVQLPGQSGAENALLTGSSGWFALSEEPMLRVVLQTAVVLVGETLVPHVKDLIEEEQLPAATLEALSIFGYKGNCSALLGYFNHLLTEPCPRTPLLQKVRRSLTLNDIGRCRDAVEAANPESDWKPTAPQAAAWLGAFAVLLGAFDLSGGCVVACTRLSTWKNALESNPHRAVQMMMQMQISEKRKGCLERRSSSVADTAYQGPPHEATIDTSKPDMPMEVEACGPSCCDSQPPEAAAITAAALQPEERAGTLDDKDREIQLLEALLESANRELVAMWEQRRQLEARNTMLESDLHVSDQMVTLAQDAMRRGGQSLSAAYPDDEEPGKHRQEDPVGQSAEMSGSLSTTVSWTRRVRASNSDAINYSPVRGASQSAGNSESRSQCARKNLKGIAKMQQNDLEGAQECFQQALKLVRDEQDPESISARSNLANVMWQRGYLAEALKYYEAVLAIEVGKYGAEHPEPLATCHNIANLHSDMGNFDAAILQLESNIEIQTRRAGLDHWDTIATRCSLAGIKWEMGEAEAALDSYEELLPKMETALGTDHPTVLTIKSNMAMALWDQQRLSEAEAHYDEVLASQIRLVGKHHPDTLLTMCNLAEVIDDNGGHHAAAHLYEAALEGQINTLGENHPSVNATRRRLARILDSR